MKDVATPLAVLSRRAADGDRGAFREWLEGTRALVFRLALHIVGGSSDAEDVVQETYVRAWRSLGTLRDHEASTPWVCGIARNLARDRTRQRKRQRAEPLDAFSEDALSLFLRRSDPSAEPRTAEDALVSAEVVATMREVVATLDEKYRVVLLLREVDELSYEEIAAALDCPVALCANDAETPPPLRISVGREVEAP